MIYVVKNKKGDVICYSDKFEYIYEYLERLYTSRYDKTELVIEKLTGKDMRKFITFYDQYELVYSDLKVILTVWETKLWEDRFYDEYLSEIDNLENNATKYLRARNIEVNDVNIDKYLRNKLGYNYFSINTFDNYISSIKRDEIIDAVNYPNSRYLYHIYEEYHQIISDK